MSEASFHKVGVNYAVAGANVEADMAYFKSIKSPNAPFVINIVCKDDRVPIPWQVGTSNYNGNYAHARDVALQFARDPDFYVVLNMYYGPTTGDRYDQAHEAMVAEATYLQGFGLPIELSVGNELTGTFGINFAISSLTQSGGTATVKTVDAYPTHVGDTFLIYGSNRAQYNTTHTVTNVVNNNTIQFAIDSGTANPGTGTLASMTNAQLNTRIRALFTDLKTVYTVGKISYAEFNGLTNGEYAYDDWVANGLGDGDYLAIHVYPEPIGRPRYIPSLKKSSFSSAAVPIIEALGPEKVGVGEFNMSASSISGIPAEAMVTGMRQLYTDLDSLGVERAVIWSWNTNLAMKPSSGFNIAWGVLASDNGRIPLSISYKARAATSDRTAASSRPLAVGRTPV